MLRERSRLLQRLLFVVDLGLIALAWAAAFWIRFHVLSGPLAPKGPTPPPSAYLAFLPAVIVIWGGALLVSGLYRAHRAERFPLIIWAVVRAAALSFVISIGATFFYRAFSFSRLHMLLFGVISGALLVGLRLAVYVILRQGREMGYNARDVLIVGAGKTGQRLARAFQHYPWMGFRVVGFLDDRPSVPPEPPSPAYPEQRAAPTLLGTVDDIEQVLDENDIDFVYVALPFSAGHKIATIEQACSTHTASLCLVPDLFQMDLLLNSRISDVDGLPVIHVIDEPPLDLRHVVKRGIDIAFSACILILLAPLFLAIAIAIKMSSPGPVLFRQLRAGIKGETFHVYKFRTMKVHEETGNQVTQASRDDERVTAIGSVLRRTSLDELPQFINVLQGHMSVVGPRPHALAHNSYYKNLVGSYMLRHKVKPGITGWAQVNGYRGETDTIDKMKRRVEYDFWYINNWSLLLDFRIILMTALKGLAGKNAY